MATTMHTTSLVTVNAPRDWLRVANISLVVLSMFIAGYLTWGDVIQPQPILCIQGGAWDCAGVQASPYSYLGPLPVAVLGLVGALVMLGVLLLEPVMAFFAARGKLLVFGMALFGLLFSGYLTSVEAFVLHKWCEWCVGNAIAMVFIFAVAFLRLWRAISTVSEDVSE